MFFVVKVADHPKFKVGGYAVIKSEGEPVPDGALVPQLGRCRLHGPTLKGFPAVFEQDWCGDHKLDENKV